MSDRKLGIRGKEWKKRGFIALAVLVPVVTGILIATNKLPEFIAAVANFFVSEPVKEVDVNRGYATTETSQLNVYDSDATNGYAIRARVDTGLDANMSVRIWSAASDICTEANPCLLSTADIVVYVNRTNSATAGSGDVLDWNVRIDSNPSLILGKHDIKVIYTKQRDYNMQTFTTEVCNAMPIYPAGGGEMRLTDVRDGKVYRIRKLADEKCWMVDNLNLKPTVASPIVMDSVTSDIDGESISLTTLNATDPNDTNPCSTVSAATYPHKCGMSYNWAGATAGSTLSSGAAPNSVCPKGWRLPTGGPGGEYVELQSAMNRQSPNSFVSGNSIPSSYWLGVANATTYIYDEGYVPTGVYWSSTATAAANAGVFSFIVYYTNYGISSNASQAKTLLAGVRCVAR